MPGGPRSSKRRITRDSGSDGVRVHGQRNVQLRNGAEAKAFSHAKPRRRQLGPVTGAKPQIAYP